MNAPVRLGQTQDVSARDVSAQDGPAQDSAVKPAVTSSILGKLPAALGRIPARGIGDTVPPSVRRAAGFGPSGTPRRRYRAIWISDVHLGTRGCNDRLLIDFLDHVDSDYLYLVGDIIDGWRMKKRFYWPERHNAIVRRVMKRAKRGTEVIYIPGNHDEMFRQFSGMNFGGVEIRREATHTTADGRKLLIVHGDEFDAIVLAHRWLAFLGDWAYRTLMQLNVAVNAFRRFFGMEYWSLSKHAKHKVKSAVSVISRFEEAVAHEAKSRGVDGVVCGHIHTAEIKEFDGCTYYNDGDWVEGCNALVEHEDGRMELLHWPDEIKARNTADVDVMVAA